MMEDKTPIYMVLIVAIVAVIGLVIVLSNGSAPVIEDTDNGITGNVVLESNGLNSFGKFFFAAFLVGIAAYMYYRHDE